MILCISQRLPLGPPPGHPQEPQGICRDCQIFVALGCRGNYPFCSQRLHPRGQQWGVLSYKNDVGACRTFEAFKSVDWYHLGC